MGKRLFDVLLAGFTLIVATPLLALIGLGVYASVGRPVLFRQRRVGRGQRPFLLVKFRSMRDTCDEHGVLLPDEMRVTRFGRLLRRSRLDELPELVQIVAGEMSLVGPRPLPPSVIGEDELANLRHASRPGLTGLSQVSGNTLLDRQEKVALDILYIDTRSMAGDIAIILRTLQTLLVGERRDEFLIGKALAHAQRFDRRS